MNTTTISAIASSVASPATSNLFDYYAENGAALLRVAGGQKGPTDPDWHNLTSTNPNIWNEWTEAGFNVGVHSGESDWIVVDIDIKHDGAWERWCQLCRDYGDDPGAYRPQIRSRSGGHHIYFRTVGDVALTKRVPVDGVELRAGRHQTLVPPSQVDGLPYMFYLNPQPPYDAPRWMVALCQGLEKTADVGPFREAPTGLRPAEGTQAAKVLAIACEKVAKTESNRNIELNNQALFVGHWVGNGEIASDIAIHDLLEACDACGLLAEDGEQQCKATIRSGLNKGMKEPARTLEDIFPSAWLARAVTSHSTGRRGLRQRRVNAASLAGQPVPKRDWYVEGWIPMEQVTLLYGDGSTGKSLLTLQLAAAGASEVPASLFFGLPVKRGHVEYITAEDSADELHRRLADITREMRLPFESLGALSVSSFADEDAIMAALNGDGQLVKTGFYDEVADIVRETKPALLVLDTLADIYGGNEIVRAQARAFVNMLRKIAIENHCAVLVLAHPSLDGMRSGKGTSGSTGWNNSVRSRLYLNRIYDDQGLEPDTNLRILSSMKMNYGVVGAEIRMRWQSGAFVPVASVLRGNPLQQQARADRAFLDLLEKARSQNIDVHFPTGRGYAPKVFKADAEAMGVSYSELQQAMKRLIDSGKIVNAPYGPPSRIRYRLQLADGA